MMPIFRISREIFTFGPMEACSSPGEILAGPRVPRISMIRRTSLLFRGVIMVELEFGAPLGSKLCVAVGNLKHDVLMTQPSDHHKNLVDQSSCAKEGFLKAWRHSTSRIRKSHGSEILELSCMMAISRIAREISMCSWR